MRAGQAQRLGLEMHAGFWRPTPERLRFGKENWQSFDARLALEKTAKLEKLYVEQRQPFLQEVELERRLQVLE
jgi:hypothetical protein